MQSPSTTADAWLAEEVAPGQTTDIHLTRAVTQSDLAAMVGGTRQRVNQIIGDSADECLIALDSGAVTTLDLAHPRDRATW